MRQRIDPRKSLVGFVVGDVTYALEIGAVREVTNPLPVVALPQAPPAVVGVADYRGAIVPVVAARFEPFAMRTPGRLGSPSGPAPCPHPASRGTVQDGRPTRPKPSAASCAISTRPIAR